MKNDTRTLSPEETAALEKRIAERKAREAIRAARAKRATELKEAAVAISAPRAFYPERVEELRALSKAGDTDAVRAGLAAACDIIGALLNDGAVDRLSEACEFVGGVLADATELEDRVLFLTGEVRALETERRSLNGLREIAEQQRDANAEVAREWKAKAKGRAA